MEKFQAFRGLVAPLDRVNVDTDQIIPKQFLKSIFRTGYGVNLFDEWRYGDAGYPGQDASQRPLNPDFVLNQARYQGASILVSGDNFGYGSSREHAPWALQEYGFKVIIAPSFADIFFNNCFKIGLLPIILPAPVVAQLIACATREVGYHLAIDLQAQEVGSDAGEKWSFEIDAFRRDCLLQGLDDIGLTLQRSAAIRAFELTHQARAPWVFHDIDSL